MELKPEIQIKQTLRLVMTPQLQQAIKMLQLSNMELSEKIAEELVENPALEMVEGEDREDEKEVMSEDLNEEQEDNYDDIDHGYSFEGKLYSHAEEGSDGDKKREFIEGTIFREETLKEYLIKQLRLLDISGEDLKVAEILVSYIDSMGYILFPLEEISKEMDIPKGKLEEVLKLIQSLDPPGVGARDIRECLLIQLRNKGDYPLAETIVRDFLKEIKLKKFDEISKKLKVPLKKLKEGFSVIARLEPYPGRQFYSGAIRYIIPEVIVSENEEGFEVVSNNSYIPRLRINSYFEYLLKKKYRDKRIREFLSERVQRAKNFIHSLEQRENTLLRVTRAILEEQKDFFKDGPMHLKPMTLRDISQKTGLHESTISRITSSKYVQTSFGVFQLKYFFSNPIYARGNKTYSSTSIKEMIREIIDGEGDNKHLSDQKIANLLSKRGIKISRRTVTKYRKGLNILSSIFRR